MNLFKKLFKSKKDRTDVDYLEPGNNIESLSLDDIFVHNFIKKGGKFLYCSLQEEVNENLLNIIDENNWEDALCINDDLNKILTIIGKDGHSKIETNSPFFTTCEHLISENGSVLFSSNQVCQH